MFENDQFTDVTLVCEDHQQIQVHKVVLSCVSEFIKEIVRKHDYFVPYDDFRTSFPALFI